MAMAVQNGLPYELRRLEIRRPLGQELSEHKGLVLQTLGVFIVGEEVTQFIAEDGHTTWLEANHGDAGPNILS